MAPRKFTKFLLAPADTHLQQTKHPNIALKPTSAILAALREEEELDSTNNSNSNNSNNEETADAADESNPEAGDEGNDSDSVEEVPIAVPQKCAKALNNAAMPKSLSMHIFPYCVMS